MTRQKRTQVVPDIPDMVTIKEAAEALACSELTVRRRISEGKLKARRVGPRMIRIDRASLLQYLAGEPLGAA